MALYKRYTSFRNRTDVEIAAWIHFWQVDFEADFFEYFVVEPHTILDPALSCIRQHTTQEPMNPFHIRNLPEALDFVEYF